MRITRRGFIQTTAAGGTAAGVLGLGGCRRLQRGYPEEYEVVKPPVPGAQGRGSGRGRPISWDKAIARGARELGALRARGESHTVAVIGGRYRGHMRDL